MSRALAFHLDDKNNCKCNRETGTAGIIWLWNFRRRHPEHATPAGRACFFNPENVNKFFKSPFDLLDTHLYLPNNIHIVDETGINTMQSKSSRVTAKRVAVRCVDWHPPCEVSLWPSKLAWAPLELSFLNSFMDDESNYDMGFVPGIQAVLIKFWNMSNIFIKHFGSKPVSRICPK